MRAAIGVALLGLYLPILMTLTALGWRTAAVAASTSAGIAGLALLAGALVRRRRSASARSAPDPKPPSPTSQLPPPDAAPLAKAVGAGPPAAADRQRHLRLVHSDGRPLSYKPRRRSR